MILEKLILENFRQFRGRQEIFFSTIKERNVTLVHAENGFGKTALLNALLWGFYGHDGLTEDLPKKESIIPEEQHLVSFLARECGRFRVMPEDNGLAKNEPPAWLTQADLEAVTQ